MEPTKLDALARTLSTTALAPSRRGLLSGLAGGVAGLAGLALLDDADAKEDKGEEEEVLEEEARRPGSAAAAKAAAVAVASGPTPYTGPVFTVSGRKHPGH